MFYLSGDFISILGSSSQCFICRMTSKRGCWSCCSKVKHKHHCNPASCFIPSGETFLTASIPSNNLHLLKTHLMRCELDPNHPNKDGDPPLLVATKLQNLEMVTILLADKRIAVDRAGKYDISPLQLAIAKGNIRIAEILLQQGANPNGHFQPDARDAIRYQQEEKTPITLAMANVDMMKMFLKYAREVKISFTMLKALKMSYTDVANALVMAENKDNDDFEACSEFILSAAASYHNCDVIRRLVDLGVACIRKETNEPKSNFSKDFVHQLGPLPYIIHFGCMNCFHYILPHVGDLNIPDFQGTTVLEYTLLSSCWNCEMPFSKASADHFGCHEGWRNIDFFYATQLSPIRLDFVEELLKRGIGVSQVWDKFIYKHKYCTTSQQKDKEEEMKAMHFLIQVHHCTADLRLQTLYRDLGFEGDFLSLVLLYLDGYNQTEEDITTIVNTLNQQRSLSYSNHDSVNKDNFHLLTRNPRTLQGLAVLFIRQAIAPDVFYNLRLLPLPSFLKQMVLLKSSEQLVPDIFSKRVT